MASETLVTEGNSERQHVEITLGEAIILYTKPQQTSLPNLHLFCFTVAEIWLKEHIRGHRVKIKGNIRALKIGNNAILVI